MDVLRNTVAKARRCCAVRDEDGLTTVGMAVSLTLCLALVFSSAQVYRAGSLSAEIQEVADVAALAAQNEVAEFMILVRTCDALSLSMTLLGAVSYGAGIVALCVPSASAVGEKLIELGGDVFEKRDGFAEQAVEGLNRLQRALPFLATLRAAEAAASNGGDEASYRALAVLVSGEGETISLGDLSASSDLSSAVEKRKQELVQEAAAAEEASQRAQEAKRRAFDADCGACPGRCMRERAEVLAGLAPSKNPQYYSVDVWSFEVALERARAYYAARLAQEAPNSSSVEDRSNSAIRRAFYAYASAELEGAYVHEGEDFFEARFPLFAANTDEMRSTALYTDEIWPVSVGEGGRCMHAWDGCPAASGSLSLGSIAQMEQGGYAVCPVCGFEAVSVGSVAAASSSIGNGFEYHYRIVASAVEDYESAYAEASPHIRQAKSLASEMFDAFAAVLEGLGNARIEAEPPGSLGCVALVFDTGRVAADAGFESSFVPSGVLGARFAAAGATMVEEPAGEGRSVISSLLDGFASSGAGATGAARSVLSCWSVLLESYGSGQESILRAVKTSLESVPLVGSSGLGTWAAEKLEDFAEAAGLQPASLDALKAVVVNTSCVVGKDSGAFSRAFSAAKDAASRSSSASGGALSLAIEGLRSLALDASDELGSGFELARIELPVGGVSVPITLALPESAAQKARGIVDAVFDAWASLSIGASSARVWQ